MQGSHTMGSPRTADPGHIPIPPPAGTQPTWVLLGLLSTTGKPLWLEEVSLRMSTTVPTRSILRRQVTGVLMTSLQGRVGGNNSVAAHPKLTPPRTQHLPAPPITSGGRGGGCHAAGEGAGDHQAPVTTAGHRHPSRLGPTARSEGWWWPPAHLPGREGVGCHRGLPVQEGHALQLDVHVIQPLQGEPSCQQRPAEMLRGCSQAAAPL